MDSVVAVQQRCVSMTDLRFVFWGMIVFLYLVVGL